MYTIPATTVPAVLMNQNHAECTCGMTMHIMPGQTTVYCSRCGGVYPVVELGYNESAVVQSTWHHKELTHCTVENAPHW